MRIDTLTLLRAQAANHILADRRLSAALCEMGEHAYLARRGGFFGSIHAAHDHIVTTTWRYLDRLEGTPHPPTGEEDPEYADRAGVLAAEAQCHARLKDYMAALTPDDLSRVVLLHETERWGRQSDPVWLILQHVFAHAVHHRGQIHDLMSQAGLAPPQLDEFFLSMDIAERRAEAEAAGVTAWMIEGL